LTEQTAEYDVLIAGGGMVGAALACALGEAGFRVAVIETRAPQRDWPPEEISNRVSALTRASEHLLRNLGAWPRILELGATPYTDMHVWDRRALGEIHFDSADIGEPDLGHIAENRAVQLALWERMESTPQIRIHCPAAIREYHPETTSVSLEDGSRLKAHLVVAADGARSALRDLAGISVAQRDLGQMAVVSTVRMQLSHHRTAWQRFLPTGPLAFLPVDTQNRCSIVWSTTPEEAERLLALDDDAFRHELAAAGEHRLGEVIEAGPRAAFPLRSQLADRYVEEGLALVGDAAHAIHPLAGQGVNLGFLDAATLAEVLANARAAGRPFGAKATLRRYERARKGENLAVMRAMEGFNQLFSNRLQPLWLLRNLGLRLTDAAGPVKNVLMRRALGFSGERPALSRPDY